ncbi:MAG: M23 family metallopeptidase [Candidatus Eisenbacteria bacterium]
MNRRYRVMLVPEDGGEIRSFHVRRSWVRWVVIGLCCCLLSVFSAAWMFSLHQKSRTQVAALERENRGLLDHVAEVAQRLDQIADKVAQSEEKEREARLLAGLDPLDSESRRLGVGGPLLVDSVAEEMNTPGLAFEVEDQTRRLDELERRVAFQRRSFKEAIALLTSRRDKLDRTPTISPLRDLHALSSGYGWREDPFTGEEAFHYGIDMRAPEGTPVYASAAGTVVAVEAKRDYGLTVVVDHGDGVETRYAHLSASDLDPGASVSRGDVIGEVGNSGRSTGPHVHYEVRIDGVAQNPANYIVTPPSAPAGE